MEKTCAFYISEIHFITMILPFVKKQLISNTKIITFFERDFRGSIDRFLSNLIINDKNKKEILKIDWSSNKTRKYSAVKLKLKNSIKEKKQIIFLVSGSKNYIKEKNEIIEKFIKTSSYLNIKIINCFEVSEFDDDICEILDSHEYILNTAGVHKIKDIFVDYKSKTVN